MSLRTAALRGSAYLTGRELLSLVVKLGGAVAITRLIGPSAFGVYAGSLAIVAALATLAQLGAEVYLIRQETEPDERQYDEVFTVLLVSSIATVAVGLVVSSVVAAAFEGQAVRPFQALLLGLPLSVLWAPAQAKLERAFRFRSMAILQFGNDVVLYAVAVALAVLGAGVWAPVAGTVAASAWLVVRSNSLAAYRPRIAFSRERARSVARFGLAFTPAGMLGRAEQLANPILVGYFLGSASVGYVALAGRLTDIAGLVPRAALRVALVAFGRVQDDAERLRRGFEDLMKLQTIALGSMLVALTLAGPVVVPILFGDEWRPAVDLLPYLATALLVLGVFAPHVTVLYLRDRPGAPSLVTLARFVALLLLSLALVPTLDLTGYGLATALSALTWTLAAWAIRTELPVDYRGVATWSFAFVPLFWLSQAPLPWAALLCLPMALALLTRSRRAEIRAYATLGLESVRGEEPDEAGA